ncbi:unnamed protein product [Paramecium sonneborni]|uniref:Protein DETOXIFICATION n=1 Tax=Paramecium sonneborni TaxID=65129 RepID=A0A8S1QUT4_9CILI|nr:unnamed protein product [Paramecium sonneborni]
MIEENIEITTFSQFLSSFETLLVKALPTVIGMELSILTTLVNMYFIIGRDNVIGIGFGTIYVNLLVKGLLLCMNSSITTLMTRQFKLHHYVKIGISYQRSLLLNGVFLIVITPAIAGSTYILSQFNIPIIVAQKAIQYVWEMLPALYAFTYFDCTKNYLQSMGIDYPVLVIQIFTTILHIYLSKQFIVYLDLGIRGAAWCKNFSSCTSSLLLYIYIFKYQKNHPAWIEWDRRSLKSIFQFSYGLLHSSFKNYLQNVSFEIMGFVALWLTYEEFSVCVCLIFTAQALYMFYLGVAMTAAQRIRRLFKDQEYEKGRKHVWHYLATSLMTGILLSFLLVVFKQQWIALFYMDNETSLILSNNLKLFLLTLTIGGMQIMLANLLGALGEVAFTINVQLLCQYAIGIGTGIYWGYYEQYGLKGLWFGWACGLSVSAIVLFLRLILLNWEKSATKMFVEVTDETSQIKKSIN